MREELKRRVGKRGSFSARVERYGKRTSYGYEKETILVCDVRDEQGAEVTDHLWFTVGKQIKEMNLQPGEKIFFFARVAPYKKGYRGRREDDDLPLPCTDYCLKFPNQFRRESDQPEEFKPELYPLISEIENLH